MTIFCVYDNDFIPVCISKYINNYVKIRVIYTYEMNNDFKEISDYFHTVSAVKITYSYMNENNHRESCTQIFNIYIYNNFEIYSNVVILYI